MTFLNVGQGDSILVRSGTEFLLVDSGEPGNEEIIKRELNRQGGERLQTVVATHPHADHIGSFPELFAQVGVGRVILPEANANILENPALYERFLTGVRRSGARVELAIPGKTYSLGSATFTILGPIHRAENPNNVSVVLRLVFGSVSFLLTGDAEVDEEQTILQSGRSVKSTVLKCGHHGSDTSTSPTFLNSVSPKYAVISCGKNNSYGHPAPQTLNILRRHRIRIFRTDRMGNIYFGTDGKRLKTAVEEK
ncbi:MAG: ComEC/Rec2 family competence protein [Acutalibacteraceae bacterium]|nr:ComEC/Rec2 family competence protein [Acutalibacteraceae bacterium]